MYKVNLDDNILYIPGDKNYMIDSPVLDIALGESGSFTFICPKTNPLYSNIQNRKSMISVCRDGEEIFYGEVRNQEKDFMGNKKVSCVGVLAYLSDSIQPQNEYHDMTPSQLLRLWIAEHNKMVENRKEFTVGQVTVTDSNDSLYRYTNYETTLECIRSKLVDRLGGYIVLRHEEDKLYIDWLKMEDIGVLSTQTISFGENLLDYTEDLSADEIASAVIPLGAEMETKESDVNALKKYVDITSVNDGKNYIVSQAAHRKFGWVCSVQHWNDVHVPSNLLRKGQEWLTDSQFENITLHLKALDLSLVNVDYERFKLGDKIRCTASPYGMDKIFPVLKLSIPLLKPEEARIELGSSKAKGYIEQTNQSYSGLVEEAETSRKIVNAKIKDAVDNLTAQMQNNKGGYKLSEYDEQGRWLRDLYMDTMDKNTATKVLQVNLHGIGGSRNGYAGPYSVGMTLDGQILGERIVAGSITGEKLSVSYTSQVETKIEDSKNAAINAANSSTDEKLKNYYTTKEINTKFSTTDRKIEASVETITQNLQQKNGNYYGGYTPNNSNAPANSWNTDALKKFHEGDFFFNTSNGYAYRYALKQELYEVKFSPESRTESENYDYVQFFYEMDGKMYASEQLGGTSLSNMSVYIPTHEFWIYWRSDHSNENYYGFKIAGIRRVKDVYTESVKIKNLPSDAGDAMTINPNAYPESEHLPYLANDRKLWKFSGSQLSTAVDASWVRVKDADIDKNNDEIQAVLKDKSGNYNGPYEPTSNKEPCTKWTSNAERLSHVGDMFYNTLTGYAYRYTVTMESLRVTFAAESRTESVNYDYVQIFFKLNGSMYALPRIGGSDISNAQIYIPATEFYVYWRSDSSNCDYYGFKISNIEKVTGSYEMKGALASLPADATIESISGTTYPESEHSPYGNNVRKLWKYTSSETLGSYMNSRWIRVQDQDINIAKTKAEEAISRITVAEGNISTMVKKGEFGTYMQQNYNSFLLGFNSASKYIQIKAGEIGLYNGTINNSEKRAVIDEQGIRFYRDGYYVGLIGTNRYSGNSAHKGLVFDLDAQGKYMAFAELPNASAGAYTTMLCFSRANSIYKEYGLHLGCNFYCHGHKIINPQWEGGNGINATINYVQILSVDSSGNPTRWGPNGRMVFKNGVLMDLNYYA